MLQLARLSWKDGLQGFAPVFSVPGLVYEFAKNSIDKCSHTHFLTEARREHAIHGRKSEKEFDLAISGYLRDARDLVNRRARGKRPLSVITSTP